MTRWEYTYLWWEGSATSTGNGRLGGTTLSTGEEVMDGRSTTSPPPRSPPGGSAPEAAPPPPGSQTRCTYLAMCID